jgi:hypothetical protein
MSKTWTSVVFGHRVTASASRAECTYASNACGKRKYIIEIAGRQSKRPFCNRHLMGLYYDLEKIDAETDVE